MPDTVPPVLFTVWMIVTIAPRGGCGYLHWAAVICAGVCCLLATECRSYTALLDCIRARLGELDLTYETLDYVSGVQQGYSHKILGPRPVKTFGPVSLGSIMGALALKITIEVDDEQAELMRHRWVPREVARSGAVAAAGSVSAAPYAG